MSSSPSAQNSSPSSTLSTPAALWRLKPFVKPVIWRLAGGAASALIAALIALMIPIVLEQIISGPVRSGEISAIVWGAAAVFALALGEALMVWLRRQFVLNPSTEVEYKMRTELYSRLQTLPVSFHDRWGSGQLLSRMMQDIGLIRRWLAFGLVLLVVNVLTIIIGSILLFRWHWLLGAIFLVTAIPLWIRGYLFEKRYGALTRRSQDQAGDLATSVEESVHGIRVLKAFGRGKHALSRFSRQAETLRETEMSKAGAIASIWFWLDLMPQIAFGLSLMSGIWLISQGQIDEAQLFAFFAMAVVLRWPIESIGFLFSFMLDARTATDRVFDIFSETNTITDPENPVHIAHPRGELAFENAHFRYQDAGSHERDLLDGIDLVLRPGETMALVGLTGSGKTTLTTLPTRLYDVTGGRVTLDGVDVRDLPLAELRQHIAMAFEDATLFSATVRENVLLGRAELDVHSEEGERVLREALEVAQASFVDALPEGVETVIGEEGLSLSGGQRQRLALARAVAAKPKVLVLDDPLSALDVDTEALVEEALRHVLADTTALIVAHRPSTVALADRVALLEGGRVTAVGTHSELLKTSRHYRHVISSLEAEEAARTGAIPIIRDEQLAVAEEVREGLAKQAADEDPIIEKEVQR
ncbi:MULTISPECIES: ABC transporter ATP-binding protein [Microbacterium]|uniref:ABC transporter ATP-binding protein/permease n=1 Tax=Microbacterium aurugineum TaxID=2851642 RepID=A0ABY4J3N3_9MICO|nr:MULTISPECIES: ABC transporter ATP-binding protein [Microbacterium]MCE0508591.1 ABC transporter ATP-binding protein/permease [Microbacterium sp. KKR3/1]MCK8466786.1 ABC transporter ATP-binding protein/permease [Microbacterium aurugineum]MCK8476727.1 ABC transporter ATP-binding protein/permease [Microbacterium aurugineum]TCJ23255.1 ABC transporter ATP-binding protein [Microbacterium sp. PI-1]TFB17348.1 ABC transporter ATP-binding protein [Microbacterium sp. 3H14]